MRFYNEVYGRARKKRNKEREAEGEESSWFAIARDFLLSYLRTSLLIFNSSSCHLLFPPLLFLLFLRLLLLRLLFHPLLFLLRLFMLFHLLLLYTISS